MRPDRSNYEIWLTDWLDGKLSERQSEELMAFLDENPDLKEELKGLDSVSLNPPHLVFNNKRALFRAAAEADDSQFDNLCISKLENDITPEQAAQLDAIVNNDDAKRKAYHLMLRMKLSAPSLTYRHKARLRKSTPASKILRISLVTLSAAATIAAVVSLMLKFPQGPEIPDSQASAPASIDTLTIESPLPFLYSQSEQEPYIRAEQVLASVPDVIPVVPDKQSAPVTEETVSTENNPAVFLTAETDFTRLQSPEKIFVGLPEDIIDTEMAVSGSLIAYKPDYIPPLIEYRSNVELFMAKLFHERIMKDKNSGTKPVETFDIARAGILGLNKLFGWELALDRNTDINGETRSYYFASRLVKVNAPVRKTTDNL